MDIPFELQKIRSEMKTDRELIHRALGTQWNALQNSADRQSRISQVQNRTLQEQSRMLKEQSRISQKQSQALQEQSQILQEQSQILQEQRTTLVEFIDRSAARQEHFLDLLEFQAKETDDLHFRLSRVEQKLDPPAA